MRAKRADERSLYIKCPELQIKGCATADFSGIIMSTRTFYHERMTFEEERDYNNAKFDAIKAKNSIQKLKPELREQLLKELVGAEAYASVWQVLIRMGMLKESK